LEKKVPKIDFKYGLNQEVLLKNSNICGIIVGLYHGINGDRYEVLYIYEGSQHAEYFPEALIKISKEHKIGFNNEP
jgi:hypothetical protein